MWRWLAKARVGGGLEPERRKRFTITPEIRRLLALWGGNTSAVHRELVLRAQTQPDAGPVPSLAAFHRALRRDLTPGYRAGLARGEAAKWAFDVFGKRPVQHRNAAWEGDRKCVPVKVRVEDDLAQPWVTWFIDCATKVITGVAVTPHAPNRDAVGADVTTRLFADQVPLARLRADPGPLVRWVTATRSRVAVTSRGTLAAVLISPTELAELDQHSRRQGSPDTDASDGSGMGRGQA